jgi:hypothetical protein
VERNFPIRKSHNDKSDKGLDEAAAKNWSVVSMKGDLKMSHRLEKKLAHPQNLWVD